MSFTGLMVRNFNFLHFNKTSFQDLMPVSSSLRHTPSGIFSNSIKIDPNHMGMLDNQAQHFIKKFSHKHLIIDSIMITNLSGASCFVLSLLFRSNLRLVVLAVLLALPMAQELIAQGNAFPSNNIRFSKTAAIVMEKTIPFGSTLGMGMLKPETTWEIEDNSGIIASGSGNSLNEYVFNVPGNFQVNIHENLVIEPGSCAHNTCPDMISLKVSNVRMTFHYDEVTFTDSIRVGLSTEGITMLVPVTIERYNPFLPITFSETEVRTAGVGTEISAHLDPATTLREGKQTLTYHLSGKASMPAYIMFDFVDVNGMVQAYSMTHPINQ